MANAYSVADLSDRELDAKIAEHLMGWLDIHQTIGFQGQWLGHPPSWPHPKVVFTGVPEYSTDLYHAWTVLEFLRQQGWLIRIQEMPDGFPYKDDMTGEDTFWVHSLCLLYPVSEKSHQRARSLSEVRATAASTPRAICEAAYMWYLRGEALKPFNDPPATVARPSRNA
jgi:hypothetical protein